MGQAVSNAVWASRIAMRSCQKNPARAFMNQRVLLSKPKTGGCCKN